MATQGRKRIRLVHDGSSLRVVTAPMLGVQGQPPCVSEKKGGKRGYASIATRKAIRRAASKARDVINRLNREGNDSEE